MAERTFNTEDHPHLRYNQLKEEWVLVSPHRTNRPWKGAIEPTEPDSVLGYNPKNPLCPGNTRSSGKVYFFSGQISGSRYLTMDQVKCVKGSL